MWITLTYEDNKMIKGVLKRISAKSGTTKGREWTMYTLCVGPAGNNDNDSWYKFGFDAPPVKEGSVVSFNLMTDNRGHEVVDPKSLQVDKTATEKQVKAAAQTQDARQMSIIRQAATKVATHIASVMLEHEVVTLPKAQNKRYDFLMALIKEIADAQVPVFTNPPTVEELVDEAVDAADSDEFVDDDDPWAFTENDNE